MTSPAPITLMPSPTRRLMGVVMFGTLGVSFLILAFAIPKSTFAMVLLALLGGAMLAMCMWMWQATQVGIVFDGEVLADTQGTELARLEGIVSVDRGTFAFKPANGFMVITRQPHQRRWLPGIYWRFGRRIGVGGVLQPAEVKALADQMNFALANART